MTPIQFVSTDFTDEHGSKTLEKNPCIPALIRGEEVLTCPSCKRQQRDVAGLLDRRTQTALVWRAHTGQAARNDLPALGHKLRQQAHVFVIDRLDLLSTKLADLLATKIFSTAGAAFTSASGARTWWTPLRALSFACWCCGCMSFSHNSP